MNRRLMSLTVMGIAACAGGARAHEVSVEEAVVTIEARSSLLGVQPATPTPPPADPASFWDGWKRNAEVGINGSEGNSETFSGRGLIGVSRKTSAMESSADLGYIFAKSDGTTSKSRGEANIRNDWVLQEPWGFFVTGKLEFDEFQTWRWRASAFLGPSYNFIKDDRTLLRGRLGLGASYEWGRDAEEDVVPALDIGVDFERKLTERSKIYASLDYLPSLSEFPEFRAIGKAGYEVLVDPESGMSLKLGVADRYDSAPGDGKSRNDFEYFALLAWTF
jgi:Protein of unknown function, DUF481